MVPSNIGLDKVIITSASVGRNSQVYLDSSIAINAQSAAKPNCPKLSNRSCLPRIETAVDSADVLKIQAGEVLLLVGFATLSALISFVIGSYAGLDGEAPQSPAQLMDIQPAPYSALASAQNAAALQTTAEAQVKSSARAVECLAA